jgi:hypothetical protein
MNQIHLRALLVLGMVAAAGLVWGSGSAMGAPVGIFDTEMLSMDLHGVTPIGPFMIRESPSKASLGKTSIQPMPGGGYHIDSFFDVFTELSVAPGTPVPEGTFDTEMLSMDLRGVSPDGPFMIRESPTLPSLGHTSIKRQSNGLYHIDSFFDIFTELSLDGGQTWVPGNGRMTQRHAVPLPAAVWGGGVALAGVVLRRRLVSR